MCLLFIGSYTLDFRRNARLSIHFMPHIQRTLVDCCADSHVLPSQCRSQRTPLTVTCYRLNVDHNEHHWQSRATVSLSITTNTVMHVQMDKHFEAQWLTIHTAICIIMKLCILSHCVFMSVVLNRCRVRFCEVFPARLWTWNDCMKNKFAN